MMQKVSFFRSIYFKMKSIKSLLMYYVEYAAVRLGIGKNGRYFKENRKYFNDSLKAFCQMIIKGRDVKSYVNSYKNKTVKAVRVLTIPHEENVPVLLCATKDDLQRVKAQVEYYRTIGIKHFAYIDNMSTDGTFEWLEAQNDISLFRVEEKYSSNVKNAWLRQVTDVLGYNKWYLIIDSDEFFMYPGIENHPINEYINFLEQKNIQSVFSLTVDMYSKSPLFKSSAVLEEDFRKEFCYFDRDTYKLEKKQKGFVIQGGPRFRIFSTTDYLTKYPLVKISKSMIIETHRHYPMERNFDISLPIACLLHYKFLPQDNAIYEERLQLGVYSGGSHQYKKYKEIYDKNSQVSLYYDKSEKLNDSMDLMKIELVNKEFFDRFLRIDGCQEK